MTQINFKALQTTSLLDGFKNNGNISFSTTITGQTLTAGGFVTGTATGTLVNTNSVTEVQVQLSGSPISAWIVVSGRTQITFPNDTTDTYAVEMITYFSASTLTVKIFVINQTGGSVTIPTLNINCRAFLFNAPF